MCFLVHIGKTGGSYLKHVLAATPETQRTVRLLPHDFTLETAMRRFRHEQAVFGIRAPAEIFVSGFYSRQRQGKPRHHAPWSPAERLAFAAFRTPNELAETLGSGDAARRESAEHAMRSITHAARCMRHYLISPDFVRGSHRRIDFIFRQGSLDADIARFLRRSGAASPHEPIDDDVIRHRTGGGVDTQLSPAAQRQLDRWYQVDIDLFRTCEDLAEKVNTAPAPPSPRMTLAVGALALARRLRENFARP